MLTSAFNRTHIITSWFTALLANLARTALAATLIGHSSPVLSQPAQQPTQQNSPAELLQGVPDVTIFVVPTSGDTARVSLAYRKSLSHNQVRQEVGKLKAFGWGVGDDIGISDGTMRPGDTSTPITTFGHFSLFKAPQVQNNAPVLLPYLQAFQDLSHISVVFDVSDLRPFNGVNEFDSSQVSVRRIAEDGAYHYEALILDHSGKLSELISKNAVSTTLPRGEFNAAAQKAAPIPLLPLMLILSGLGILGGLVAYGYVAKRVSRAIPTRNSRS